MLFTELDYDYSGDDLGTSYYTFRNTTIAKAVNHVLNHSDNKYKIVSVDVRKEFWLFGELIIKIVIQNPNKIRQLEDSQHYSKSDADPNTVVDKKTFNLLVEWLCTEYEPEEAVRSLEEATFTWINEKRLDIRYSTGVVNKILFEDDRIVHLNPYVNK